MNIQHIVITLFSFRGKEAFKRLLWPGLNFTVNPLNPRSLKFRLLLFELSCLQGVLSQTNQKFTWVIVIDKDLPEMYKSKLQKLIKAKKLAFIWEYNPKIKIESIEWLKPYIKNQPNYLVTSNLDDDDILPPDFTESVKKHIEDIEQADKLPTLKLAGNKHIYQWDLVHSKQAPLGWKSKWHRGKFHASCGFSLIGKYPQVHFNVLGIVHRRAEKYFDFSSAQRKNKNVSFHQKRFKKAFENNDDNIQDWCISDLLFDLGQLSGPVLMINHKYNAQYERLHEKKTTSIQVSGPETFPEFKIDWQCAFKNAKLFNFDLPFYLKRKGHHKFIRLKRKLKQYMSRIA